MKIRKIITIVAYVCTIVVASIWYGQHHGLLPEASSEEANLYDALFSALITVAFGLFLLVESLLIYSVIAFRQKEGDETDGPAIHDNFLLETIWTAVPAIMVMWIGIYSFDVYSAMRGNATLEMLVEDNTPAMNLAIAAARADDTLPDQGSPLTAPPIAADATKLPESNQVLAQIEPSQADEEVTIDVAAMQFAWIFTYPGDVITAELHVPIGRKVNLNMTANDVIHAFWVPEIRLKQDVIPGTYTSLEFVPNKIGDYTIICAELCGAYHGGMKAQMIAQSGADYDAWLKEQQEEMAANPDRLPVIANLKSDHNMGTLNGSNYLQRHATDIAQRIGLDRQTTTNLADYFSDSDLDLDLLSLSAHKHDMANMHHVRSTQAQ
jgi:cytochrome c oxidase subunit 2